MKEYLLSIVKKESNLQFNTLEDIISNESTTNASNNISISKLAMKVVSSSSTSRREKLPNYPKMNSLNSIGKGRHASYEIIYQWIKISKHDKEAAFTLGR